MKPEEIFVEGEENVFLVWRKLKDLSNITRWSYENLNIMKFNKVMVYYHYY